MSITKEEYRSLGRYISHIQGGIRSYLQKELEPYGLGSGQYVYLMVLYRIDGSSQEELTDKVQVDKATTARAILKLEKEGYVTRRKDHNDRRRFHVFLTKKGWDFKATLRSILDSWTNRAFEDFDLDERKLLLDLLERLDKNVEGMR